MQKNSKNENRGIEPINLPQPTIYRLVIFRTSQSIMSFLLLMTIYIISAYYTTYIINADI